MTDYTPAERSAARQAADFFVSKGLTLAQACGMVAQIQGESSFNPKAVGDKDHAFGLFQLHADRAAIIKAGCGVDMLALPPLADQLAGVWYELLHTEKHALTQIKATTTAFDAGAAACRYYERPASHLDWTKRAGFAQAWFAILSTGKVT